MMKTTEKENHTHNTASQTDDDYRIDKLADLPVADEQAQEVKGGLPAIQKVRDAANRSSLDG